MKIKRCISLLFGLVLILSMCLMPVCAEEAEAENLAITKGCHSLDAAIPFLGRDRIVQNAKTVLMFETNSETLLYEWNADQKMYPASLVKIMTALLVLEKGNLQDVVTVKESALAGIDVYSVSVKLQAGESMSVENLLYCLLVYSANDAASVLAEYISGSEAAFVNLMNTRALELGCKDTNFTNAHGLHNDKQYTTARDIGRILQVALANETFRKVFCTASYTVPATNLYPKDRNLSTNNYLMNENSVYYDERVIGGRAGETAEGERCVATLSQSGNMEVICVVMGSKPVYSTDGKSIKDHGGFHETASLLDRAYEGYSKRQIVAANQILRQQSISGGDSSVYVASRENFSTVLPSDITIDMLSFQYSDYSETNQAPIAKGQAMATLQVWYGSICIAQTDVYAMNDVPVAYQKTAEFKEPEKMNLTWVWIVVLIAVVVVSVAVLIFVRLRIGSKKRHARHYRKGA